MSRAIGLVTGLMLVTVLSGLTAAAPAAAEDIGDPAFEGAWERTDLPVADGTVGRTWMWGPEPFTGPIGEVYDESPEGRRVVRYFDKGRMEISQPQGEPSPSASTALER
jgi:hypothetical protein